MPLPFLLLNCANWFGFERSQPTLMPWATVFEGLCARFPAVARERWIDRMAGGRVVDGEGVRLTLDTPYRVGLTVHYYREVPDEAPIPFDEVVLHADGDLLVANRFGSVFPRP